MYFSYMQNMAASQQNQQLQPFTGQNVQTPAQVPTQAPTQTPAQPLSANVNAPSSSRDHPAPQFGPKDEFVLVSALQACAKNRLTHAQTLAELDGVRRRITYLYVLLVLG